MATRKNPANGGTKVFFPLSDLVEPAGKGEKGPRTATPRKDVPLRNVKQRKRW